MKQASAEPVKPDAAKCIPGETAGAREMTLLLLCFGREEVFGERTGAVKLKGIKGSRRVTEPSPSWLEFS